MSMLNLEFKPLTQADIDYQERRGSYWATSLKNVVKGERTKQSRFWRDFAGLVLGIVTIIALFAGLFAWGL